MDDKSDKELYQRLTDAAGSTASLSAYVKRVLEEYFDLNIRIAERQGNAIHEEISENHR